MFYYYYDYADFTSRRLKMQAFIRYFLLTSHLLALFENTFMMNFENIIKDCMIIMIDTHKHVIRY